MRSLAISLFTIHYSLFLCAAEILVEEFDDDRRGWSELGDLETSFGEIANGVLFFENLALEGGDKHPTIPIDLDMARDFSIDLRVKYVSGTDNRGYGFNIGRDGGKAYHTLSVSGNQWYIVSSYTGSEWSSRVPWTQDPELVKRDDYNTLSLRKIGSQWYFLVNNEVVNSAALKNPASSTIGLHVPRGAAIEADSLRVEYIEGSDKQRAALAEKLDERYHARRVAKGPPLEEFVETFDDNSNGWYWLEPGEEPWTATFADGALEYRNRGESNRITVMNKDINELADYEISLRLSHIGGADNNSIGVLFGRSQAGDADQLFAIAPNGYYILRQWKQESGTIETIPWTKIDLLQSGSNHIALRKVHDRAYIYINGQLIADTRAPEHFGPWIGLSISPGLEVAFEELAIRYFPRSRAESIAAQERLDKELAAIYRGGRIKGAIHTMTAARERDEENARLREAEQLDDKDYKQLNKVRKQFTAKSKLSLLGSWKRPADITGDPNGAHRIYYNYKQKGRKQYYYEFQIMYVGSAYDIHGKPIPLKQDMFKIAGIQLTDRKW